MFDLEKLSKIRGAVSDKNIINFFNILDQNISDKEVSDFKQKTKGGIKLSELRADEIKDTTNKELISNFPEKVLDELKIPKVIE